MLRLFITALSLYIPSGRTSQRSSTNTFPPKSSNLQKLYYSHYFINLNCNYSPTSFMPFLFQLGTEIIKLLTIVFYKNFISIRMQCSNSHVEEVKKNPNSVCLNEIGMK